jgi:uncharacterized protein YprB with RNaseH-like and TPR domain
MARIVFDIETVGEDFDKMDETTQEVLTRWIKKESKDKKTYKVALEDLKEGLGFSPLTGQIVVIGVYDIDTGKGAVYFQAQPGCEEEFEQEGFRFRSMSEKEMLEKFWEIALHANEFISFNGRGFDVPFLLLRSAIHKIKPTKDLMSNRYLSSQRFDAKHIDLMDQLTFYGAFFRRPNLHLFSRAFGIESPKAQGVTGDDVARLFREGKCKEIALYNSRDLKSTAELYDYWNTYLRF